MKLQSRTILRGAALILSFWASAQITLANIEITLTNAFIDKFKDRATIDASFIVDKAHPHPNAPKNDGDLHAAGRAAEVQLPIVAEIMNAGSETEAVDAVHAVEGSGQTIPLTGVWRLWCEHGGESQQIQGHALEPFKTTNPQHVFQIHPLTKVKTTSILESLHKIDGYQPKDAEAAFLKYEGLRCHMDVSSKKATELTTTMAGYNYVEFILKPIEKPQPLPDGTAVMAEVDTLNGDLLVHKRRMIFVKDSPPEQALKALRENEEMHVLGVPRISLNLISWRRDHSKENKKVLDWALPYEIVIVGYYETVPVPE